MSGDNFFRNLKRLYSVDNSREIKLLKARIGLLENKLKGFNLNSSKNEINDLLVEDFYRGESELLKSNINAGKTYDNQPEKKY